MFTLKIWLYIPRGRWIWYLGTYFYLIIMWSKNVCENPMVTVIWQNIWTKIIIKRKLSHIFSFRKKIWNLQEKAIFSRYINNFLNFIFYIFVNILKLCMFFLIFNVNLKKTKTNIHGFYFRIWKYRFSTLIPYTSDNWSVLTSREN